MAVTLTVRRFGRRGILGIGGAFLLLLTGFWAHGKSPEEELIGRSRLFWQKRAEGDYRFIYLEIMEPRIREQVELPLFVGGKGYIRYHEADVVEARVSGNRGWVKVRYQWSFRHPGFADMPASRDEVEEEWVEIKGTWYRKFEKPSLRSVSATATDDDGRPLEAIR